MRDILKLICLVATVGASALGCSSVSTSQDPAAPEGDGEGEVQNAAVVAEECKPVTYIEIVHRVNGVNVTDRVRLTDEAASTAALALRSFQFAANHFGAANIVSSRPITQVQCFPQQTAGRKPIAPLTLPNSSLCVTWDDFMDCTEVTPSHTYNYGGTETCTVTNHTNYTSMSCEDSSVILTRSGDAVLTINTQTLRNDIAARTQALRRLVGDANVITNFHFDVVITPQQQASIVGNNDFNNIAAAIKQAADAGQPLPDIPQILRNLPQPPANIDFYTQLMKAYQIKLERLNLLAQITNGKLLSPQQVNAFHQSFIGKSKLIDKLDVQHTPASLTQAAGLINSTIDQLATTDPSSTIYEQVKSGAQAVLDAHTSSGVFDPDNTVDFVVPNLHQFLTDADLDKRLVAAEMLVKFNEQLRRSGGRQRAHDMAGAVKMMIPALQHSDMGTVWRLWDQVQATEFFFDHTDPTGTSYNVHLTPQAQAMFNISVQPTSARAYEVIVLLNEVASYDDETGKVTIDYKAIITLNARSALSAQDRRRAQYLTEESWGVLSFLKNAAGAAAAAAAAAALAELAVEGIGILDIVGTAGWGGAEAVFDHLTGAAANWHLTMDKILELGGELIESWPGMTAAEKAELVARVAGELLESIPPEALGPDQLEEAIERAIRKHLDRAAHGLEIVQRGRIPLAEDAAVELVKQLEPYGVDTIDQALRVADALDNLVPCDIVAPMGGAIVAPRSAVSLSVDEPPCGKEMIRALFEWFKETCRERGFTTRADLDDLVTSVERRFPPEVITNALSIEEHSFGEIIIQREGGTLVGARVEGQRAVDGFLNGFGLQLKSTTTPRLENMLGHVGDAWDKAAGKRGVDLFIRCQQFTRQQVVDMIPGRFIIEHYLQDGRIGKVHFLTSDGWIDIINGVIQ
jgi:hypothetical protein